MDNILLHNDFKLKGMVNSKHIKYKKIICNILNYSKFYLMQI